MNIKPLAFLLLTLVGGVFAIEAPAGWTTASPREEIAPAFGYNPKGGPKHDGGWVIESDAREGLMGRWTKSFPVKGGEHYHFKALRKLTGEGTPRRTAVARVLWRTEKGGSVQHDEPSRAPYNAAPKTPSEPEYPVDGPANADGWAEVSGTYLAPPQATQAIIELEFRWAPKSRLEWAEISLKPVAAPPARQLPRRAPQGL